MVKKIAYFKDEHTYIYFYDSDRQLARTLCRQAMDNKLNLTLQDATIVVTLARKCFHDQRFGSDQMH